MSSILAGYGEKTPAEVPLEYDCGSIYTGGVPCEWVQKDVEQGILKPGNDRAAFDTTECAFRVTRVCAYASGKVAMINSMESL